jgi:hypothetical protein
MEGREIQVHKFLTSALVEGECLASCPGRFTSGELTPGTHCTGGMVGPRISPDAAVKRKETVLIRGGGGAEIVSGKSEGDVTKKTQKK